MKYKPALEQFNRALKFANKEKDRIVYKKLIDSCRNRI